MSESLPLLLAALQTRIGHTFRDQALLERALTHPSYLQLHPEAGENNQRLEFLGDAVLQLIVTETLFELFPTEREGALSKHRASLLQGVFLAKLAAEIGLAECLRMGASEEISGGRNRGAALEDAFEALVGALYLDSDYAATRLVVLKLYGPFPVRLAGTEEIENPKGRLQELVQPTHGNEALHYEVTHVEGLDHAREYEIAVFLQDVVIGSGRGSSKKLAEEAAARVALQTLKSASG